jgi:hypothetical protein
MQENILKKENETAHSKIDQIKASFAERLN